MRLPLEDGGPLALLPNGAASYDPAFLACEDADRIFAAIIDEVEWRQEYLQMFGRPVAMPRLTAWYGDPGAAYVYSGLLNVPQPWTPALADLRARVSAATGATFNSVLVNRYRGGADAMGWHADKERELRGVIASVSLGESRRFQLRENTSRRRADIVLEHGSLLTMSEALQHTWQHRVPRETRACGERVNLTFRTVEEAA